MIHILCTILGCCLIALVFQLSLFIHASMTLLEAHNVSTIHAFIISQF